ncbi:DUF433 domain-containing protein [Fimbriimonas ginsengisoli]|uniref:DUF433 domain-containing protein n=1 Tax=Fimbriimonas ginsengisoli Gsoil 348 TaxID=661478 RepID=A0A068NQN5_FIMGI|nr:DUF433 domain-containing protein [Fimbriimonas ginsengisoli]AIE85682.1 hypothetical protein OP10G_2314 [Fimbriimonas ginsengisoli Gsoil 348]
MVIPEELKEVLAAQPEIISGAVRFKGTRVPVQALLDTLGHGLPVSDFLEGFPDVTAEQALAVVQWQQNVARQTFGLELVA